MVFVIVMWLGYFVNDQFLELFSNLELICADMVHIILVRIP
jgi:hypothetical protein